MRQSKKTWKFIPVQAFPWGVTGEISILPWTSSSVTISSALRIKQQSWPSLPASQETVKVFIPKQRRLGIYEFHWQGDLKARKASEKISLRR